MLSWVVNFHPESRRDLRRSQIPVLPERDRPQFTQSALREGPRRSTPSRHRDEKPVTVNPLESTFTNCDECNSFRIRFYKNCRVSLLFSAKFLKYHFKFLPSRGHESRTTGHGSLTLFFSSSSALFCAFLHFLALAQNSTLFFSSSSTLFRKNTQGWGALLPSRAPSFSEWGYLLGFSPGSLWHSQSGCALALGFRGTDILGCALPPVTSYRSPVTTPPPMVKWSEPSHSAPTRTPKGSNRLPMTKNYLAAAFPFQRSTVRSRFSSFDSSLCPHL
jgi:hypothetical protein